MSMLFAEDSVALMEIEGASDEEQASSQQQQQQQRRRQSFEEEEEEEQEEEEDEQKTNDEDEAVDDDGEGADLDVDEATRLELADQQRKKERLRKQQTRHELKIFNETMGQTEEGNRNNNSKRETSQHRCSLSHILLWLFSNPKLFTLSFDLFPLFSSA